MPPLPISFLACTVQAAGPAGPHRGARLIVRTPSMELTAASATTSRRSRRARANRTSARPGICIDEAVTRLPPAGQSPSTAITTPARRQVLGMNRAYVKIISSQQGPSRAKRQIHPPTWTDFSYCMQQEKHQRHAERHHLDRSGAAGVVSGHLVQSENPIAARISVQAKWATYKATTGATNRTRCGSCARRETPRIRQTARATALRSRERSKAFPFRRCGRCRFLQRVGRGSGATTDRRTEGLVSGLRPV